MGIHDLTLNTAPAAADEFAMYDDSTAHTDRVTLATLGAGILSAVSHMDIGSFTRDTATASGNQSITGVGFLPTSIVFLAAVNGGSRMSIGFDDNTLNFCVYDNHNDAANTWGANSSASIVLNSGGGLVYAGSIGSFDSDGFTVAWVRTGAPTGTGTIFYWALR